MLRAIWDGEGNRKGLGPEMTQQVQIMYYPVYVLANLASCRHTL